jgi:hypothetical protein
MCIRDSSIKCQPFCKARYRFLDSGNNLAGDHSVIYGNCGSDKNGFAGAGDIQANENRQKRPEVCFL